MTQKSKIVSSIFEYISKKGNGGVISNSNLQNIFIKNCIFVYTSAHGHGGSVFCNFGNLKIENSYFFGCFSSINTCDIGYGNIVHTQGSIKTFTIKNSGTHLCGPSKKECSDSVMRVYGATTAFLLNTSRNFGCGGGACLSIASANSDVKYVNSIDSLDDNVFESNQPYTVSHGNIINTSCANKGVFWSGGNDYITFKNCIFTSLHKNFAANGKTWKSINCIADSSSISMTYSAKPSTHNIMIHMLNYCTNNRYAYRRSNVLCLVQCNILLIAYS